MIKLTPLTGVDPEEVGELEKNKFHRYSYFTIEAKITLADVQKIKEFMRTEIEEKNWLVNMPLTGKKKRIVIECN